VRAYALLILDLAVLADAQDLRPAESVAAAAAAACQLECLLKGDEQAVVQSGPLIAQGLPAGGSDAWVGGQKGTCSLCLQAQGESALSLHSMIVVLLMCRPGMLFADCFFWLTASCLASSHKLIMQLERKLVFQQGQSQAQVFAFSTTPFTS